MEIVMQILNQKETELEPCCRETNRAHIGVAGTSHFQTVIPTSQETPALGKPWQAITLQAVSDSQETKIQMSTQVEISKM